MSDQSPTREAIRERLVQLASGNTTREEVAAWAASWLRRDERPDDATGSGLETLVLADALQLPDGYLYGQSDFEQWLTEFDSRTRS